LLFLKKILLYGTLGCLIGIAIFTLLGSDYKVPNVVTAKSDVREMDVYRNRKERVMDHAIDDIGFEEIALIGYDTYHVRDMDMEEYKNSKVVIYGRVNPMWHWENISAGIDKTGDDEYGDSLNTKGYDMLTGKMVDINVGFIKDKIRRNGSLPVREEYYNITSNFGIRPDPFNEDIMVFHTGLDISEIGINGREVMAVLPGVISKVSNNSGYGNFVIINHGDFATVYGHLEGYTRDLEEGLEVEVGDVIGYVGSTGRSTGPHLHLEFDIDGVKVDPKIFMNIITGSEKENDTDDTRDNQ